MPGDARDLQARYLEAGARGLVVASVYLPDRRRRNAGLRVDFLLLTPELAPVGVEL